jgi:hypothetical protein
MTWPDYVRASSECVQGDMHGEWEYYGTYNLILYHLFPPEEGFILFPTQRRPYPPDWKDRKEIYYKVDTYRTGRKPVFLLDIKPPIHLKQESTRVAVDQEMRSRMAGLADALAIPRLYGISAMGLRIAVYEYSKDTGVTILPGIPADHSQPIDASSETYWKCDLLEEEGEAKIRDIAALVKGMAAKAKLT